MPQATTQPQRAPAPTPAIRPDATQEVPTTQQGLDGLIAKRAELERQLESLTDRREELADQRQDIPNAQVGAALDARIAVIDERSARIEAEIFRADEAIAAAMANGVSSARTIQRGTTVQTGQDALVRAIRNETEDAIFAGVATTATVLVGGMLVLRGIRRLFRKKQPPPPAIPDQTGRLEQLQQSMDVIAVEVERISEAQRFVSKLLNEKASSLGAGEAQAIAQRGKSAVAARSDDSR